LHVPVFTVKNLPVPIRVVRGWSLFAILGVVSVSLALPARARAKESELTIAHVFTGWRDAASFKRISEYFNGRENTGGQLVIRTHPGQRAGYYFLMRTANPGAAIPVKIELELISATGPKSRSFAFAADLNSGDTVLNLGLTGDDWPDPKANPVAWKIDLVAADGRVLATEKSYLWEKPVAP
jgi:hypothetical protein